MTQFVNYLKVILGRNNDAKKSLRNINIFNNSSEKLLDMIYNYGKVVKLAKDDVLISEGEFDQWIYIILQGSVSAYVGDKYIGKVKSSLVGERCILGENRKATLKADGLFCAFGIDMAITDVLQGEKSTPELYEAFNELLLLILKHVFNRILDIWLSSTIHHDFGIEILAHNARQQVIDSLAEEDFADRPEINAYLWLKIKKENPKLPSKLWNIQLGGLNGRKMIFQQYQQQNINIDKLVDQLIAWNKIYNFLKLNNDLKPKLFDYSSIIDPFKQAIVKQFEDESIIDHLQLDWDNIFSFGSYGAINFNYLEHLLTVNLIPFKVISKLWLLFIEKALQLNQELNDHVARLNLYFGDPILESHPMYLIKDLKENKQNEMEYRDLEILQESLINPYLAKLEGTKKKETIQIHTEKELLGKSQISENKDQNQKEDSIITDPSNYDALLKQLGATPGVPLED